MFIWTGLNIDDQLQGLRSRILLLEQEIDMEASIRSVPFHISLKMPFSVDNARLPAVLSALEDYYMQLTPFEIFTEGFECYGNIVWLRMRESHQLNRVCHEINTMLQDRFGIGIHEYDTDFQFHATLFYDSDEGKNTAAYQKISQAAFPNKLSANSFLIETSDSGLPGTYDIWKEIIV